MRHFSVCIKQDGRFLRYSAIARSSSQALIDALEQVEPDVPFSICII